ALGGAVRRCMAPVRFGLGWTALLLVLSAVPAFTPPRYRAPALPVLAVVCAVLLAALAPDPVAGRRIRLVARGLLLLLGVGGLALALAARTGGAGVGLARRRGADARPARSGRDARERPRPDARASDGGGVAGVRAGRLP